MDEPGWHQITVTYPGHTPREREHHAITHLAQVIPAAQSAGWITTWWYIRKGAWRIRYQPTPNNHERAHTLLTDGVTWTHDIYEPETHAFGGPEAMTAAHTLFHHDSHHLLTYLRQHPTNRREHSLILCTALMRAAALDPNEQGDVWAKVRQHRAQHLNQPPDPHTWERFTSDVRRLLLGIPHTTGDWHTAFGNTGAELRHLRETGTLTRGLRTIIALHVIFHWNRIGLPAVTQATLAHTATQAILGTED